MRAHNAKKRHFQVETLEERLALDGAMTINVTVTGTISKPMIGLVSSGNGSVSYGVDAKSSTNVTVVATDAATITPLNPVPTVVLPPVPTVVLPPVPTVVLPPEPTVVPPPGF